VEAAFAASDNGSTASRGKSSASTIAGNDPISVAAPSNPQAHSALTKWNSPFLRISSSFVNKAIAHTNLAAACRG
jgi:hypothetical protein